MPLSVPRGQGRNRVLHAVAGSRGRLVVGLKFGHAELKIFRFQEELFVGALAELGKNCLPLYLADI